MIYLLIHGSWHGAWCWEKVKPLLEAAGHQVLAPDLPGHGKDKTPLEGITLQSYIDCIATCLKTLDEPAIVVGHSMAGIVISQVAEYFPEKIKALVYIAGFMPQNGESLLSLARLQKLNKITANIRSVPQENAIYFPLEQMENFAYNTCPAGVFSRLEGRFCVEPYLPYVTPVCITRERYGQVPRIYILCEEDKAVLLSSQQRMLKQSPCSAFTLACDHSPFYSDPEGLVELLLKLT